MVNLLEQIKQYYQQKSEIEESKHEQEDKELLSTIQVPVSLNKFNAYYRNFGQYRYLDEFFFKDRNLIFDAKSIDYISKTHNFFPDLSFSNNRIWLKNYSYESNEKLDFPDWTDNGLGVQLKDILKLDFPDKKTFQPLNKYIYLSYDRLHTDNVEIPSHYYSKASPNENSINKVKWGKLKKKLRDIRDHKKPIDNLYGKKLCEWASNELENIYPYSSSGNEDIEGYEWKCDNINFQGQHYAFSKGNSYSWITPYVAYRSNFPTYWQLWYYYFALGEFSSEKSKSKNLLKKESDESKTSKIWLVDFDDIFSVSYKDKDKKIHLSINSKAPINKDQKFAEISSKFEFTLDFIVNSEKYTKKFSLQDMTSGGIDIEITNPSPIFSSFDIKANFQSDKNKTFDFLSSGTTYKVNIEQLTSSGHVLKGLNFYDEEIKKYFPSQFSDRTFLSQFFKYISTTSSQVQIKKEDLDSMEPSVEFDDYKGTLSISYKWNGVVTKKTYYDLKKIPDLSHSFVEASTLDEAKQMLKTKFSDVSDHFWKHIELKPKYPSKISSPFEEKIEYGIHLKTDYPGKTDSNYFDKATVYISNLENVSLYLSLSPNPKSLQDMFSLNEYAKRKSLTLEDYSFRATGSEDNNYVVDVFLKSSGVTKLDSRYQNENYQLNKKTYLVPFLTGNNLWGKSKEGYSGSGGLFTSVGNLIWGSGGAVLGLGTAGISPKLFSILKRKIL